MRFDANESHRLYCFHPWFHVENHFFAGIYGPTLVGNNTALLISMGELCLFCFLPLNHVDLSIFSAVEYV